jgi:RNA polymerase sigma-70 factor, ECF subfamily
VRGPSTPRPAGDRRSRARDLAHQAVADAVVGSPLRSPGFRGESRFTTWACKFAIFEVSTKSGRLFWKKPTVPMDAEDWDRLPDRFGLNR